MGEHKIGLKSCYRSIIKARLEPQRPFLKPLLRQEERKERKHWRCRVKALTSEMRACLWLR